MLRKLLIPVGVVFFLWASISWLGLDFDFDERSTPEPDLFGEAALETMVGEAVDLVQRHYGCEFRQRPEVVVTQRPGLIEALEAEEERRLRAEFPKESEETIARWAKAGVDVPKWIWGWYSPTNHTVYLLRRPIAISFVLIGYIPTAKAKALRLILIHELAHAMDEELYGAVTPEEFASTEACEAFSAVQEGHAEYVMCSIADQTDDWSIADDWVGAHEHAKDPSVTFRYGRGREFIEALARRGTLDMAEVYSAPPTTRRHILEPRTYPFVTADVDGD